ncbi:MAG: molybdopterin-dependent oxidoreductase [Deltaproteobacteria bacterium]|nr:molybdopterin-dependent oxidoreductase [Deltaproteobacteria bacterium]
MSEEKADRIVAARLRLRERFLARPGRERPARGSGEPNRHGEPKLPPGQRPTTKWPVLDLGEHPRIEPEQVRLVVDGAVAHPLELSWEELLQLPQVEEESDFHCVTGWSQMDLRFTGVRLVDLLARAEPHEEAAHLLCHAADGYTTSLLLADGLAPDVLLAHRVGGEPLPREHGGPLRMVTPRLYAWKGTKWIERIEVCAEEKPGFWERGGYARVGDPWTEDRYADPDDPPPGAEI